MSAISSDPSELAARLEDWASLRGKHGPDEACTLLYMAASALRAASDEGLPDGPLGAALWIDPARYHGEVCVHGTRVPAEMVGSLCITHGDDEVRSSWGDLMTDRQILVACWWTVTHEWVRAGDQRTRLGKWATKAADRLWHHDEPLPDFPPLIPTYRSDQ